MDYSQLSDALAEETSAQEIKRILVQRRAARLVLNEAKNEIGEIVRGKCYVDNRYIHGYTPETIFFCPGCKCYEKEGEVVPCDFGVHEIRVEGAAKYYPWEYTHDFQMGDDIEKTPVLVEAPPGPQFDFVRFAEWKTHPTTGKKCAYYNFKVKTITPNLHYTVYAMYEGRAVSSAGFRSPKDTYSGTGYIVGDKIGFDGCKIELRLCEDHNPDVYLHKRSLTIPEVPPELCGHLIVEECIIPDSLFIEEPAEFIMRVKNCTEEGYSVQFRETISFRGVDLEKEYHFKSEWSTDITSGATIDIPVIVELPKSAIPAGELGALYDIFSILEAKI